MNSYGGPSSESPHHSELRDRADKVRPDADPLVLSNTDPEQSLVGTRTVEAALLRHPRIEECVVLPRTIDDNRREPIAYIVSSGRITNDELYAHLRDLGLNAAAVAAFVPVSSLPLTGEGYVDEDAL